MAERAVVLLSGGLDSATTLALARADGFECHALSFAYGQRSSAELRAADRVAQQLGVTDHQTMPVALSQFGGSALTDPELKIPTSPQPGIPVTYVPARNTVFLSLALAWAEVLESRDIFIGVNAVDYSGYPDCRPAFIAAFERVCNLATRAGVEEGGFRIHTPLMDLSKAGIIQRGAALGVDYALTVSCYDAEADGRACGQCDSCHLRAKGFRESGLPDPTLYASAGSGP